MTAFADLRLDLPTPYDLPTPDDLRTAGDQRAADDQRTLGSHDVDLLTLARRYADHPDDWPLAPRFDPLTRWYHRLAAEPDAEVWLLTWLPGQHTGLHDHGASAGAFVVVSGTLTEHTLSTSTLDGSGSRLRETRLPSGAGRRFGAPHIHQLGNAGDRPAVSVHVYGPALHTMTRYRLDGGRLEVTAIDRAGAQW